MYICTPCRTEKTLNQEGFVKSYGQCELCDTVTTCDDIPSRDVQLRPEPATEVDENGLLLQPQ